MRWAAGSTVWQRVDCNKMSRATIGRPLFLFFKIKGDIKCALIAVKRVSITDFVIAVFFVGNVHRDAFSVDGDDQFIIIGAFTVTINIFVFDNGFTFDGGIGVEKIIDVVSGLRRYEPEAHGKSHR